MWSGDSEDSFYQPRDHRQRSSLAQSLLAAARTWETERDREHIQLKTQITSETAKLKRETAKLNAEVDRRSALECSLQAPSPDQPMPTRRSTRLRAAAAP